MTDSKPSPAGRLRFLDRSLLKGTALLLMTLGHWCFHIYRLSGSAILLRFLLAAEFFAPPVFFFFLAEGFRHTRSKKQYALRLLTAAVITQIPHAMIDPDGFTLRSLLLKWSVLMTLFLGLLTLIVLHSSRKLPVRIAGIAALAAISLLLHCEWAVGGIAVILCFDLLRERPLLRLGIFSVLVAAMICVSVMGIPTQTHILRYAVPQWCAGLLITFCYNGKKGELPACFKYFFYIWYPLHLLLSWVLGQLI